jgi:dTDP-4-amino-4,6-dideoxygalactose transaminase
MTASDGGAPGAAPHPGQHVNAGPRITFNRPHATGREFVYIKQAIANRHLSGNGPFTARCGRWLEDHTGAARALLTGSCSSALELAAILAELKHGDEVIMPSFTFVSTANAVALRGATPVFVDIRADTLNLDERLIEDAITERTKAILPVHYAGVACEMEEIMRLAAERQLLVIEDAAQGVCASFRGRALGGIGDLGCVSFHETKNVHCGEGGALMINDPTWIERAEILHEKGTNRSKFFRGEVEKYTWVELGSSFVSSEISAAYLWAQLEAADEITAQRLMLWRSYHERFAQLEDRGLARRPVVPPGREHNGHLYYLLVEDRETRDRLISNLRTDGIQAVFHYVPLHTSPAGRRLARAHGSLSTTEQLSDRLVRLPLWLGMGEPEIKRVADAVGMSLQRASRGRASATTRSPRERELRK